MWRKEWQGNLEIEAKCISHIPFKFEKLLQTSPQLWVKWFQITKMQWFLHQFLVNHLSKVMLVTTLHGSHVKGFSLTFSFNTAKYQKRSSICKICKNHNCSTSERRSITLRNKPFDTQYYGVESFKRGKRFHQREMNVQNDTIIDP